MQVELSRQFGWRGFPYEVESFMQLKVLGDEREDWTLVSPGIAKGDGCNLSIDRNFVSARRK